MFIALLFLLLTWEDRPMAIVNDRIITKSFAEAVSRFAGMDFPSAVSMLVQLLVVDEWAKRKGITVSETEIQQAIERISASFGGRRELEARLEEVGIRWDEFRFLVKAQILRDKALASLAGFDVFSENELREFWLENKDRILKTFESRYVLWKRFDKVPSYLDPSTFEVMGWVRRGEIKKEFEEVIFSTPEGQFSKPFKTPDGVIIFFIKRVKRPTFDDLKNEPAFRDFYIKTKYEEVFSKWLKQEQKKHQIKIIPR